MINQITSTALKQHFFPQRERTDVKIDDQVNRPSPNTSLSTEASQRIVNDKIIDQLDKVLQKDNSASVRTLDPKEYTPESVAKQILSFVQNAIDRAEARGSSQKEIFAQAQQGINKGFQDAENILSSLNALSGKIAEGVQNTYELIQNGLSKIADSIGVQSDIRPTQRTEFASVTQSKSNTLNLTIQTNDGDTVDIAIGSSETTGQFQASIQGRNGSAELSQQSYESSNNISFSVQGSLDQSEVAAIEELLGDIKQVSDKFFDGDVSAALETGLGLGFNAQELTSFSLSLNQNQSETATRAYREISGFGAPVDGSNPPPQLETLLKPIQGFVGDFKSSLNNAGQSGFFNDPDKAVEDVFNFFSTNSSDQSRLDAIKQLETTAKVPFENITHDIISQIKSAI